MGSKIKGEKPSRPARPSEDPAEETLWAFAVKDVKPLPRKKSIPYCEEKEKILEKTRTPRARRPAAFRPIETRPGLRPPAPSSAPPGPQTDGATERKIRRGTIPIDARLDLHGMTRERAHGCLIRFLIRARESGARCVLVITGKGRNGNAGEESCGVLRRHVPEWLKDERLKKIVLEAQPAHPRDGGSGALYVLLKKNK